MINMRCMHVWKLQRIKYTLKNLCYGYCQVIRNISIMCVLPISNNYHYLFMTNTRKYHVTDGQRNANKTDGYILINEIHPH